MGTDIHMIAERKIDGVWETFEKEVFPDRCDEYSFTCIPYDERNYNLFAILANVRNGHSGGCRTGERFNPISESKGYPLDMDSSSMYYMSQEHSMSWLTLKEIYDFDWEQLHRGYGCVSEQEYKETIMIGENPYFWCGDTGGGNIVKISETEMVDLIQGVYPRQEGIKYYTFCYFYPKTYRKSAEYFLEMMNILKKYVPEGGTLEDVRIVFDFDS